MMIMAVTMIMKIVPALYGLDRDSTTQNLLTQKRGEEGGVEGEGEEV